MSANSTVGLPRNTFVLFYIACIVLIAVSGNMLEMFGYSYISQGGSLFEKIHPSTMLFLISLLSILMYRDGYIKLISVIFDPAVKMGLVCIAIAIFYTQFVLGKPLATLIVSWLTPFVVAALLIRINYAQARQIELLLYIIMAINNGIGVVEYIRGEPIFPPVLLDYTGFGDTLDTTEWGLWRASGLFGHPLTATSACGTIAVTLFSVVCFKKASFLQVFTLLHTLAVMPFFGGRTSIFVMVLCFLMVIIARVMQDIWGRPSNKINLFSVLSWGFFLLFAIIFGYLIGYFDQFIARLVDDQGSALTRVAAVEIFLETPWPEIFLGDFSGRLIERMVAHGTVYGVEIFWIGMVLIYGLIPSFFIFLSSFILLRCLHSHFSYLIIWPIVFFVLAISSGVGLAAKSVSFSFLLLNFVVFVPWSYRSKRSVFQNNNLKVF